MKNPLSTNQPLQPELNRPWTVYLIHHAHTDIGYTESQKRIQDRHTNYVDQALEIIQAKRPGDEGFVWNQECLWALETWWREASPERRQELGQAVKSGRFGISGTYAHFNELIDDFVLRRMLGRAKNLAGELGTPVDTAISADINGFGWGYSQALYDNAIENLIVFLHPHHGLAPIGRRQAPFWWETSQGNKILVWLGEHYMLGNNLGLCPRGTLTFGMTDEWTPKAASEDNGLIAKTRLPRYLRQLELDGYAHNFVGMGISGTMSDNAPPNVEIARFARKWNEQHGNRIRIEMTTASHYAKLVREQFKDIPVYRGDWPDWWSDGYASQPYETRLCRQAQRDYSAARSLAGQRKLILPPTDCEQAEQAIALYAEHTFGHSDSVRSPWDGTVKMVGGKKRCFAFDAAEAAEAISDQLDVQLGAAPLAPDRPFFFRVVNPLDQPVRDCVRLYLEESDFGVRDLACYIRDVATGNILPCQKMVGPRGMSWGVWLEMQPFETRDFEMLEGLPTMSSIQRLRSDFTWNKITTPDVVGSEGHSRLRATAEFLESPHVRITWEKGGEITSWFAKDSNRCLLSPQRQHGALTPVYERTPVSPPNSQDAQMAARGRMGRNRKGTNVVRTAGRIVAVEPVYDGPLCASVRLDYELPGCSLVQLVLTVWKDAPRVDVALQINKDSVWDPENLYLSLPFTTGAEKEILWLDKAGCLIRPGVDQLPDTLTDFYTMQNGFVLVGSDCGISVASPDAPLLQLGSMAHGLRPLMGAAELASRPLRPYGWLMTNFWETNFDASLGGFHEFRYRVEWGTHLAKPTDAMQCCHALNHAPHSFRAQGSASAPA